MMKRKEIFFTESQIIRIDNDRGEKSRSEAVRRIVDFYFELKDKEKITNDKDK